MNCVLTLPLSALFCPGWVVGNKEICILTQHWTHKVLCNARFLCHIVVINSYEQNEGLSAHLY